MCFIHQLIVRFRSVVVNLGLELELKSTRKWLGICSLSSRISLPDYDIYDFVAAFRLCFCLILKFQIIGISLRDWSLITGRGGATKWENCGCETFWAPPPQDRVKLYAPPFLKSGNFSRPPYNMAKTSSYRVKTTPKLFVPPLQHDLNFFRPPFS